MVLSDLRMTMALSTNATEEFTRLLCARSKTKNGLAKDNKYHTHKFLLLKREAITASPFYFAIKNMMMYNGSR